MDVEEVKKKYGVAPNQVPDYLALAGDKADGSMFHITCIYQFVTDSS